ncbi:hypothetical protein GQ53DRAFT_7882 [Thozetella sp. PMI_491]|nr:hypothetical protein GQ53DRAFT_7882 [Thozetella sp. PMI_491]
MRFSSVLALSGLIGYAAATGSRGAAERAAYFIAYVMEEIFEDPKDWTIAPGCIPANGGRDGLLGQKKRCTLIELCDYLWIDRQDASGKNMGDTKPVLKNVRMTAAMNKIEDYTATKIMNGLMAATEITAKGTITLNTVQHGYVGGTDPSKLSGGKETDWYKANMGIGDTMARAKAAIVKAGKQDLFKLWTDMAPDAVNLVIDLRRSDGNKIAASANGIPNWSEGRPVQTKPYKQVSSYNSPLAPDVDRDGTIKSWQKQITSGKNTWPALSSSDAKKMYDNAVDSANSADGNHHKMANEAASVMKTRSLAVCK